MSIAEVVLHTSLNAASAIVCLLAAILVCCLNLHRKLVYRLALYQLLASLALATTELMQVYHQRYLYTYGQVCTAIGWLVLYSRWVKLLFITWVSFHLFSFLVLQKNLNKLEVWYVVTSLTMPSAVACIPLLTHSYGVTQLGGCFLHTENDTKNIALIEEFVLWDGPSMAFLLVASVAMISIVIKLVHHRLRLRFRYEAIGDRDQFRKALKQLLPLAAFPILFFALQIPMLIYHVYLVLNPASIEALLISIAVFVALWTMTSGLALLVHVFVARCLAC